MKFYSFEITQPIKASRRKIYATWVDPKLAKRFAAPPGCIPTAFRSNFKVGGKYASTMKTPHGLIRNSGEFLEITPNQKIIQTFIWDAQETEMNVIVLEFADRGKNSVLKLKAHGFSVKEEAAGNREGWKASLEQFASYFKNR
jgi:uncharacterized protein YndB with AHSA1/START domain